MNRFRKISPQRARPIILCFKKSLTDAGRIDASTFTRQTHCPIAERVQVIRAVIFAVSDQTDLWGSVRHLMVSRYAYWPLTVDCTLRTHNSSLYITSISGTT